MNRAKFFLYTIAALFLFNNLSFGQNVIFDFENYVAGEQLACQDSINWTTFFGLPCDPVEDPYISTEHSLTGTKSVKIVQNNDLVKTFGSRTVGKFYIRFWVYIPSGKAGYFNVLNGFTPNPFQWGMECYFDVGGGGRLLNGSNLTFNWTPNIWQFVQVEVDLNIDQAQFWFDGSMVASWQWTRGNPGSYSLRLDANNFFGATVNDEMYIDNYYFVDPPLTVPPLNAPSNLILEEIFNLSPQVKLNWQDNSNNEYGFIIIRKSGVLFGSGRFTPIGTTYQNINVYFDSTVIVDSTYNYAVIAYNEYFFSDTSNFATITVEPVPVELISFTYEITSQGDVTLNWITATETNNMGFEIERASSMTTPIQGWSQIGFVEGHGTTTEIQFYNFTDKNVIPGKQFYKLKQIDFDGSYEYSPVLEINILVPLTFSLEQNYPNPFNPVTNIRFQIAEQGLVSIKVYDLLGKEVAVLVNEEKEAGNYEVEFDATSLSSGMYIYKLSTSRFTSSRKMLLMK